MVETKIRAYVKTRKILKWVNKYLISDMLID